VVADLPALRDVDDMADARAVAAMIPGSRFSAAVAAVEGAPPPVVYVAVGASETTGTGSDRPAQEAWPHVLVRTALPTSATYVNLGIPGATVATALREELPRALELEPTLVTVWLNVNDLVCGVPPALFERDLSTLVRSLRRAGRTQVLVANVPPLDRLPAYLAYGAVEPGHGPEARNAVVAAYNAATERVTDREGAVLVDLHAAGLGARRAGTEASLVSADGFHPSTAGHLAVAAAFAEAVARVGGAG
jgi:lysophospholipase L1-like esterase